MKNIFKYVFVCACGIAIPALLVINSLQALKYKKLEREVSALEKKQVELVEENKRLITNISLLSSSDRIEKIASEELGMHKAESEEIVRVEMKK
ncbi:MAG: septum formation initiator family protein [Treponema sp.]|nr:septum formation initiator family protein [Treponema sp.]